MNPFIAVILMAAVTYALRAVPLIVFRRPIENPWLLSFLAYVPPAVLTAMTFPAILFATRSPVSGVGALLVALALALLRRNLTEVAVGAAVAVLLIEGLVLPL